MENIKLNFSYVLSIDYDTNTSNCSCDGYCRCGVIQNISIGNMDSYRIESIFNYVIREYFGDKEISAIHRYCIDMILNHLYFYNKDYYDVRVTGGYYGQEIGKVLHNNNDELFDVLNKLSSEPTGLEKLLFTIEYVYRYIAPELKNVKTAEIKEVDINTIKRNGIYTKVERDFQLLNDIDLPYGILLNDGGQHFVIDGNKRLSLLFAKGQNKGSFIILT